jgi:hypothetical protein
VHSGKKAVQSVTPAGRALPSVEHGEHAVVRGVPVPALLPDVPQPPVHLYAADGPLQRLLEPLPQPLHRHYAASPDLALLLAARGQLLLRLDLRNKPPPPPCSLAAHRQILRVMPEDCNATASPPPFISPAILVIRPRSTTSPLHERHSGAVTGKCADLATI